MRRQNNVKACQNGIERILEKISLSGKDRKTFAEKTLEISRTTLYTLLKGDPISLETLIQICDKLNLEWQEIAEPAPDKKKQSSSELKPPNLNVYNTRTWVEREAEVKELLPKLQAQTHLLWITGISGIGKTALGECLASRAWESNPSFQWLNWEILEGRSDFVSVAESLLTSKLGEPELTPKERNAPEKVATRLLTKLRSEGPYWIQLDSAERLLNAEQPADFADTYWVTFLRRCINEDIADSRLVFTAQAAPRNREVNEFSDRYPNIWTEIRLKGLSKEEQYVDLFFKQGVDVDPNRDILVRIATIYEGHPLVLQVIAQDILNKETSNGDVSRFWQEYQAEFEQDARAIEASRLDETEYNLVFERRVRGRIKRSIEQLPADALELLCRSAVFRPSVRKEFWLAMIDDRSPQQKKAKAAYQSLDDRTLIEKEGTNIRLHNLLRTVAYDLLRADVAIWHQSERQAAALWLTAYQPRSNAKNLEKVTGYLEAFYHFLEVQDVAAANEILETKLDDADKYPLKDQLHIWSYYREEIQIYSKLLAVSRITNDAATEGFALEQLGDSYEKLSDYSESLKYYRQCLDVYRKTQNRSKESESLNRIGNYHFYMGNFPEAIDYYQQSLSIASEIGDRKQEGSVTTNLGFVLQSKGEHKQAIYHFENALEIAQEYEDLMVVGTDLGCIGYSYYSLGEYSEAIKYYNQRIAIAKQLDHRKGIANGYGNLVSVYIKLKDYEKARFNAEESLKIIRKIGAKREEGSLLGDLGNIYFELGEYDKAIEKQREYLKITQEIHNRRGEAIASLGLGDAIFSLDNSDKEAFEVTQKCLEISQEGEFHDLKANALTNLAEMNLKVDKPDIARQYCQQALALATELGIPPIVEQCEALQKKMDGESEQEPTS